MFMLTLVQISCVLDPELSHDRTKYFYFFVEKLCLIGMQALNSRCGDI